MNIKFKKSYYNEKEIQYIEDALINNTNYIDKTRQKLSKIYNDNNLFLTCNGSSAFDLLFLALDFDIGSEVIMPSYTFPSAANTVLRFGLKPVFVDIDKNTSVMDLNDVASKITDKTCCIIPTHYGGTSVDMHKLKKIAGDIKIIEDAALSIGATYKEKALGTIGDYGIVSFHNTKNISSDEGGMLLVNDDQLLDNIDVLYNNGTNRSDFDKGKVSNYSWQEAGINCSMSNINAALLYPQLLKLNEVTTNQKRVYDIYLESLIKLSEKYSFQIPAIPSYNENNYHVFYLIFDCFKTREFVRQYLIEQGIQAYTHYFPLHMSNMGKKLGYSEEDLPVTKSISERILRLPIYASLTEKECDYVIDKLKEALCKVK